MGLLYKGDYAFDNIFCGSRGKLFILFDKTMPMDEVVRRTVSSSDKRLDVCNRSTVYTEDTIFSLTMTSVVQLPTQLPHPFLFQCTWR